MISFGVNRGPRVSETTIGGVWCSLTLRTVDHQTPALRSEVQHPPLDERGRAICKAVLLLAILLLQVLFPSAAFAKSEGRVCGRPCALWCSPGRDDLLLKLAGVNVERDKSKFVRTNLSARNAVGTRIGTWSIFNSDAPRFGFFFYVSCSGERSYLGEIGGLQKLAQVSIPGAETALQLTTVQVGTGIEATSTSIWAFPRGAKAPEKIHEWASSTSSVAAGLTESEKTEATLLDNGQRLRLVTRRIGSNLPEYSETVLCLQHRPMRYAACAEPSN